MVAKRIVLPQITEANYEAVRNLLKNGVPTTYAEWLDLRTKWLEQYADDTIVFVEVDPKEFAAFFDAARYGCDLKTLLEFVWSKVPQ